jgi:hypothetical protein
MANATEELRAGNSTVTILVRLLGMALMLLGLFLAGAVLFEIWNLYKNPEHVERFAQAVERGSNIDTALAPRRTQSGSAARVFGQSEAASEQGNAGSSIQSISADEFRLSYFFAWFIVFVLLMIVSRFALAAITTGGRLALFDMDISRFARALVREVGKAK